MPKWWNWQTHRTQNPAGLVPWGFDSPLRHHIFYIAIKTQKKTKDDRYIPVSKLLKELLSGIDKKSEYVFTGINGKVKDFKDSFKSACKKAGFEDLRIHDLRHVFGSKMVMNGTSLYITGELLGHKTTQMTKRYSHLVPSTLKKAVNDVWDKK